jgi:hypothetical protein
LQKSLLKSIVNNTNHIKKISINVEFKLNGKFSVIEEDIGINEASTFEGFCNKHDTEVFSPIEANNIDYNNMEHLFLLLYRSITREYYESNKGYFLLRDVVNDLIKDMSQDNMLGPCLLIQLYLQYCECFYLDQIKESADICLQNGIWDNNYLYFHITLDKFLPIFMNSFFAVQGTNCDILYTKDITKEFPLFCSVTVIPQDNKTNIFYSVAKEQCSELIKLIYLPIFDNHLSKLLKIKIVKLFITHSFKLYQLIIIYFFKHKLIMLYTIHRLHILHSTLKDIIKDIKYLSFSVLFNPLQFYWLLTNSLYYIYLSLSIPLGYSQINGGRMYATFFVRDKGIAKQFQRTKNVAEKKRTKGARPTAFFRSPSRRKRRSAYRPVMCRLPVYYYLL